MNHNTSLWWGPPKKFDPNFEERKISWLELFYDLVYVIAISRITHLLCLHFDLPSFIGYFCLFALIFWGWLNGSLYHDLHGSQGLRTRLMTLWQMAIISAFSVMIGHEHDVYSNGVTIVFIVMQIFITYLWWSVGIYDKEHRKYNLPYTIMFLLSLVLLGISLFVSPDYRPVILFSVILLNYIPPFIAAKILKRNSLDLPLSPSMTERLGLFTIIVFGEVVLGVVNGFSEIAGMGISVVAGFILSLSIVFTLWWIFFTLISNRNAVGGFVNATLLEILFIPALISLGIIAVSFSLMFKQQVELAALNRNFCFALGVFPACISMMMGMLLYPGKVNLIRNKVRISLFVTSLIFLTFAFIGSQLQTVYFLACVLIIILAEITYLNSLWYGLKLDESGS